MEGTVLSDYGNGIGGAIVTLEPLRLVEYTDQNGAFVFHGVPVGTYVVLINLGSFEARSDEMTVLTYYGRDKWKYTSADRLLYSYRLDNGPWSTNSPEMYA